MEPLIYLEVIAIVLAAMFTTPALHEGGHYLAARLVGFSDARIGYRIGNLVPRALRRFASIPIRMPGYVKLDPDPRKFTHFSARIFILLLGGILGGALPILLPYYCLDTFAAVVMATPYIYWCRDDLRRIRALLAGRIEEATAD